VFAVSMAIQFTAMFLANAAELLDGDGDDGDDGDDATRAALHNPTDAPAIA